MEARRGGGGRACGRDGEAGLVLVNVLVMLALSATVVFTMLSLGDLAIARSQRFSEAGQALSLVRAGEQAAIVALRRDMIEAPETDHAGEPWGAVAEQPVEIAGGGYALEIEDAQGRFNLNAVASGGLQALETLRQIAAALDVAPATAARIAATLARDGPLRSLDDLTPRAGVDPEEIAQMARFVTALPGTADVNVNAVSPELLAVLLQNPVQARVLDAVRTRNGSLTEEDVWNARAILPAGTGYRSTLFRVTVRVRIGDTSQAMESLLQRRRGPDGLPQVAVVARRGLGAPGVPPPPG